MKICNLASGSTGNCTFVELNKHKILIDVGKNKKYIVDKLKEIDVDYHDIEYIFLTHTHDDHTSALKTFLKNHHAKLVITKKMLHELKEIEDINVVIYEDDPDIEGLDIKSLILSHDVLDIRGFIFTENENSVIYITDTGYINSKYFKFLNNKSTYFIESNHDIELLTHGPYPDWLKKRVLSDEGHLSNKFTGMYLNKFIGDKTNNILLLHLSEKNNNEQVALNTVSEHLGENLKNININCAKPNERSELIII